MAQQGFSLTRPAFSAGAAIPNTFMCDGQNQPPRLKCIHAHESTQRFAQILDVPDAPHGTLTHWLLFDIPTVATSLQAGERSVGIARRNGFQQSGDRGPCTPPNHGDQRFDLKLFAVNTETLNLLAGATRKEIDEALQGDVLRSAELMGRFQSGPDAQR